MPSTMTTPELIVFTDLDGTLLDRTTYSFEAARPALDAIRRRAIPLVLVSSKTRAEMELYRERLENTCPFISENGGAVFIPREYFSFPFLHNRACRKYFVLELGIPYPAIVELLDSIRKETGIVIQGFSDLTEESLAFLSGLSLKEAECSKKREYGEPFSIEGGEKELAIVTQKIRERGLSYSWGGRFHHVFGGNDKGKAVTLLKNLYAKRYSSVTTLGIGDSPNDFPMLCAVDHPIFLKGDKADTPRKTERLTLIEGNGSRAWNFAILDFLSRWPTPVSG
jgi:mannosyl-3-phosphoglycerate phosphatase